MFGAPPTRATEVSVRLQVSTSLVVLAIAVLACSDQPTTPVAFGVKAGKASFSLTAGSIAPMIASGNEQSCGVRSDGSVVCWGSQAQVPATLPPATQVSVESLAACARHVDGGASCWNTRNSSRTPLRA